MGYCPRCGEHSTFSGQLASAPTRDQPVAMRVPMNSKLIKLPDDLVEGETIMYGGARFVVRHEEDKFVLEPVS